MSRLAVFADGGLKSAMADVGLAGTARGAGFEFMTTQGVLADG